MVVVLLGAEMIRGSTCVKLFLPPGASEQPRPSGPEGAPLCDIYQGEETHRRVVMEGL